LKRAIAAWWSQCAKGGTPEADRPTATRWRHTHTPNPNKAREGKRKHRLILDPVRAPIVLMIFEDYYLHSLGLGELCDKLNSDLDRYPPPQPNHKDEPEKSNNHTLTE
jgi:hypothetical protein